MGFGLLFIGYFVSTLMTLNPVGSLFRFLGYAVILLSVLKLRKYHRAFDFSIFTTILMMIVSCGLIVSSFTGDGQTLIAYIEQGCSLLFHAFLLYAVFQISKETGVKKLSDASVRNFVFICFYNLVSLLDYLPIPAFDTVQGEMKIISIILYFSYMLLNLLLFGQCYANICDEKDAEMNRKASRFAWVNSFREEFDRREEKARKETELYRKEKQEKRKQRKKR